MGAFIMARSMALQMPCLLGSTKFNSGGSFLKKAPQKTSLVLELVFRFLKLGFLLLS